MVLVLLAACVRPPPSTDGGFTVTLGDDDDVPGPTGDTGPLVDTGCVAPECAACEAAGFWPPPVSSGAALVAELNARTSGHDCADYSTEREWIFVVLDNEGGEVECVYTGRRTAVTGAPPSASDMNMEHSWPQSLGADYPPAECDAHHLFPVDAGTNSRRGNTAYGEVEDATWSEGGSSMGPQAGGGTVFEPRDEHKGNAARAMLYFAMRYGHTLPADELALYRAWHALDPVDDVEIARSLAIGERQGAANPYVVCAGLVERL